MSVGGVELTGSGDRDHTALPQSSVKITLELICFPSSTFSDPEITNMQKVPCRSANGIYFKDREGKGRQRPLFSDTKMASQKVKKRNSHTVK